MNEENIIGDNVPSTARDEIAAGLAALPPSRRRSESIAAAWKRDDRYERMRVLHEQDPERFDEMFGPRRRHRARPVSGGEAAAGHSPDPEAA